MNTRLDKQQMVLTFFPTFFISQFPLFFLYASNAQEVHPRELISPFFALLLCGIIGFLLCSFVFRSYYKGSVFYCAIFMIFGNYALFESGIQLLFSRLKYWHVLLISLLALFYFGLFLKKKIKDSLCKDVLTILGLVLGGLCLFNIVTAIPSTIQNLQNKHSVQINNQSNAVVQKGPNIYLLIFDEYSNFDVIEKYYDYDNSDLYDFLQSNNFEVSKSSRNDSRGTTTVLTNFLNLDYVVTDQTPEQEKTEIRKNSPLLKIMHEHNYTIHGVGDTEWLGIEGTAGKSSSAAITGETFSDILMRYTVLYPFVRINSDEKAQEILSSVDYLCSSGNIKSDSSQFVLAYFDTPHQPFVFDQNGNSVDLKNAQNWKDKKYYLNQYIYTTKLMKQIVENILKNDPNCILLLQADHSARASSDPELAGKFISFYDMKSMFNAVYYGGNPLAEIHGQSGVNTLRIVLNQLFSVNFDILEVPDNDAK